MTVVAHPRALRRDGVPVMEADHHILDTSKQPQGETA
jgi:hypothetical protein